MDKIIVGLTGNICTGKSWVAKQFSKYESVKIIDCDVIAKKLLVKQKFDLEILNKVLFSKDETGAIIRYHLKNNFYKKLWENIENQIKSDERSSIFIVESALIFELNWYHNFDEVYVTHCDEAIQFKRILEKFPNKVDDMCNRLSYQMTQREKLIQVSEDYWICTNDSENLKIVLKDIYDMWEIY